MNETSTSGEIMSSTGLFGQNVTEHKERFWNRTETVVLGILLSIIMIITIIGNFMVITIILKFKKMRSKTNLFFLNLAVADIFVGLFLTPTALATLIKGDWIFGSGRFGAIVCSMNGFAMTMLFIVSIHSLMYMSIYKYFGINYPLSAGFTKYKVLIMIGCAWLWAIVCSVITLIGMSSVEYKNGTTQCGAKYPVMPEAKDILHHLLIQITNILIPISIIVFTQTKIFCAVKHFSARMNENSHLPEETVLSQRKRVTVTIFIVVMAFVICWIPYFVYAMHVSLVKNKSTISNLANPVAYLFAYFNSACNPVIYGLRNKAFREGYKRFLPGRFCCSQTELTDKSKDGRPMLDLTFKSSMAKSKKDKISLAKDGVYM